MPYLEVFEGILVQSNLADTQYQQKSEILYTFLPNKSYAYLLNAEPSNSVFFKNYNTEFDEIIIKLTVRNGRAVGVEDKVSLALPIIK